ncbi:MAG: mannonate dehydratase [Chloroflexota bacterium]
MELSFRWYGENDQITLQQISQIPGMKGIVTALFDVPAGVLWPEERLADIVGQIESHGMTLNVVESLPVHEDIKLGRSNRDELIEVYRENIGRLGAVGVKVICYNFMPLFDWFRTDLAFDLPDGSNALLYDHTQLDNSLDPWEAELPAYFPLDESPVDLKDAYKTTTEEDLWNNLKYFLDGVCDAAETAGVQMALHPDDPPWSIFGLPRIIKDEASLAKVLEINTNPANGLTFCTGSMGANRANDLPQMIRRFGDRIYFAHCRNVKHVGDKHFHEVAHPPSYGDVDMVEVLHAFADIGFTGPLRPDHGRMIWGETGIPGYGLYDRAIGANYLLGVWDGLTRDKGN